MAIKGVKQNEGGVSPKPKLGFESRVLVDFSDGLKLQNLPSASKTRTTEACNTQVKDIVKYLHKAKIKLMKLIKVIK